MVQLAELGTAWDSSHQHLVFRSSDFHLGRDVHGGITSRLLASKLVAGETEDHEALVLVLLVNWREEASRRQLHFTQQSIPLCYTQQQDGK